MAVVSHDRRQPFAALELPLWAQMTDAEIDALSESDVSDTDDYQYLEDSEDSEEEAACSSGASTVCSPDLRCSQKGCWDSLGNFGCKERWADLEDSDDEAALALGQPQLPKLGVRWADLEDSDDEALPVKPHWADLQDSDDE